MATKQATIVQKLLGNGSACKCNFAQQVHCKGIKVRSMRSMPIYNNREDLDDAVDRVR